MFAIEVSDLRKTFRGRSGKIVALDGLDFNIPEGSIFGFLGPNGAGKTTTIRCLLGLTLPDSGSIKVLDQKLPKGLPAAAKRVGASVEGASHFPSFSGRRNLEILATLARIPRARIDECLASVGLEGRADDTVQSYSLGMRQRLGLAAALLRDPELLLLDEPAVGLDPAGIRDLRNLLQSFAAEGKTVFLSSHLLSEVELICDQVAIIFRGRVVRVGSVKEILERTRRRSLMIRVAEPIVAKEVLASVGVKSDIDEDGLLVEAEAFDGSRIVEHLARAGIYVRELTARESSLEEVFFSLTSTDASEPTGVQRDLESR